MAIYLIFSVLFLIVIMLGAIMWMLDSIQITLANLDPLKTGKLTDTKLTDLDTLKTGKA